MNEENHTITEWTIHPVKENRLQAGLVIVVTVGIAYALALVTGNASWTLFYFAIFLISLHRYFLPTHYRLIDQSLEVSRPWRSYRLELSEFRSFTETSRGVQLNRMGHDSFVDRLRGVYILTGNQHSSVISHIRNHLERA